MPERKQRRQEIDAYVKDRKRRSPKSETIFSAVEQQPVRSIETLLKDYKAPTIKRAGWILDPTDAHDFIDMSVADRALIVTLLQSEEPAIKFRQTEEFTRLAAVKDFLTIKRLDDKQKKRARRIGYQRAVKGFSLLADVVQSREDEFFFNLSSSDVNHASLFLNVYGPTDYKEQMKRQEPRRVLQLIDVIADEIGKKGEDEKDFYTNEQKLRLWAVSIALAQVYFVHDLKKFDKSKYFIRDHILVYGSKTFREHGHHEIFEYIEAQRVAQSVYRDLRKGREK